MIIILTLMPVDIFLVVFQLALESIVTSSTSDEFNVFNIPHIYWSTSSPSNWAGLLKS